METARTQLSLYRPSNGTGARLGGPGPVADAHEHQGPNKAGRGQSEVLRETPRGGEPPGL